MSSLPSPGHPLPHIHIYAEHQQAPKCFFVTESKGHAKLSFQLYLLFFCVLTEIVNVSLESSLIHPFAREVEISDHFGSQHFKNKTRFTPVQYIEN